MPIQLLSPLKCNTQDSLRTGDSILNAGLLSFLKTYYFSAHTVFFSFWTCIWKSPNSHWAPNSSSLFTVKSSENLNSGNGKILSNYRLSNKIHLENFLYKMTNHSMCKLYPTEINEILCLQNKAWPCPVNCALQWFSLTSYSKKCCYILILISYRN